MSEVVTAAFIIEKAKQVRKESKNFENTYRSRRRNATILSDAKLCAIYHQQRKLEMKKKFKYEHRSQFNRLVIILFLYGLNLIFTLFNC